MFNRNILKKCLLVFCAFFLYGGLQTVYVCASNGNNCGSAKNGTYNFAGGEFPGLSTLCPGGAYRTYCKVNVNDVTNNSSQSNSTNTNRDIARGPGGTRPVQWLDDPVLSIPGDFDQILHPTPAAAADSDYNPYEKLFFWSCSDGNVFNQTCDGWVTEPPNDVCVAWYWSDCSIQGESPFAHPHLDSVSNLGLNNGASCVSQTLVCNDGNWRTNATDWTTIVSSGDVYPTVAACQAAEFGVCGTNATSFAAGASDYTGRNNTDFCAGGTLVGTPGTFPFPNVGASNTWICDGLTSDVTNCTASRSSFVGQCGTAHKNYPTSATSYGSDTFCAAGTATPIPSNFPALTQAVSWDCVGGTPTSGDTVSCAATHYADCPLSDGTSLTTNTTGSIMVYNATTSTCGSQSLYCNGGTLENGGSPVTDLTFSGSVNCEKYRTSCGSWAIEGLPQTAYQTGFYPNQLVNTFSLGVSSFGFCDAGMTPPASVGNIVLSTGYSWSCGVPYGSTSLQRTCTNTLNPAGLCGSAGSGGTQTFLSLNSSSNGLCDNGSVSAFTVQPISASTIYTARYIWDCVGTTPSQFQTCTAFQVPNPTPGLCNAGINGQSLSYAQFSPSLLCTQGVPSQTVFSAIPNSGTQRAWTCLGLGGAANVSCSVNAVTDGVCASYPSAVPSQPTSNLCISGAPTAVSISNGSYVWLCNGTNGGISSPLCQATCLNGQCALAGTGGTNTGNNNNNGGGGSTTTGNGQTSPISLNQVCSDADGCVCYNVTIINGATCLSNNLTGVTDSIRSPIDVGETCLDADGCICNGLNQIVNGSVCQTDGTTGVLPGMADLIVSQAITSGTISRRGTLQITISYFNRGPSIATGAKLEYYLSPLVSRIRTSAPYTLAQINSSGYIESSEYQNNSMIFPLGDIRPDEGGQIKIDITLNAKLSDSEVANSTSIASRVRDSKPLDNAQKLLIGLDTQQATTLAVTIINPFIGIQSVIKQYDTMISWLRIDPIFDDVQRGDDDYMSIMTVVRNGIFEGYRFKYKRSFGGEKCTTRTEAVNVIARMMYTAGATDVYVSRQKGTAYVDLQSVPSQSQTFINRSHERGLLKVFQPKSIKGSLYLEPNKEVTQGQVKQMIYLIYQRYGLDPSIVESLLMEENSCLTRSNLAYVITQILRGNPNIMMGYNDEFLKQLITKTSQLTIVQRRVEFQKVIDKLKVTEPSVLFANGYDGESLIGILEAAMAGRIYNPVIDVSSTANFLYQKRE